MKTISIPESCRALAAKYTGLSACRVVQQEKGQYRIIGDMGEQSATVSGKFMHEALTPSDYPTVGDYVLADLNSGDIAVIRELLPRKSVFVRRAAGGLGIEQLIAANIDILFLCMSLNNDFNVRRLERYLTASWDSGATPVVLLTKADLCGEIERLRSEAESVAFGAEILVCNTVESDGYSQLLPLLTAGKTVAFVGSSGVGKSTLINRLLGEDYLETNGLRNDDRGRHTTTRRQLLLLENGVMVIDTPGMREFGVWDADEGMESAFSDIETLAKNCKFKDCKHENEPDCAVKAALESGELDQKRWKSYLKIRSESSFAQSANAYLAAKERKFKQIAKYNKTNKKK